MEKMLQLNILYDLEWENYMERIEIKRRQNFIKKSETKSKKFQVCLLLQRKL